MIIEFRMIRIFEIRIVEYIRDYVRMYRKHLKKLKFIRLFSSYNIVI